MLRKLIDRFIICAFLVVIVYLGCLIIKQEWYLSEVRQETAITQERLNEAQNLNQKLKEEKSNLEKPEYVEKVAREELGMTKPGEVPYISSDKNSDTDAEGNQN